MWGAVQILVLLSLQVPCQSSVENSGDPPPPPGDVLSSTKQYLLLKNTLPQMAKKPVRVTVHLSLESIRDVAGEATIDLYMTEQWHDPREVFHSSTGEEVRMSGQGVVNYCWIPDSYFILARSIFYSPSSLALSVTEKGNITLDRKVRLITPCRPEVQYFPFDVTQCRILISSYGFDASELYLSWMLDDDGQGISFPFEYEPLSEMGFEIIAMNNSCFLAEYGEYSYTILEGMVYLKRLYAVYIYQIYIPAALLVVLSWVTFWINRGATPARASVGVTTVLTMLTLATQSQQNMEKHITLETSLLDIYIWVCFSFVIAAMLEFAVSDFFHDKSNQANKKFSTVYQNNVENSQQPPDKITLPRPRRRPRFVAFQQKIDKVARLLFPLVFLLFNLGYWGYVVLRINSDDMGKSSHQQNQLC